MGVLHELERLGQSIWFDNISRSMLASGSLRHMVQEGLLGVTSNPTIFDKAISGSGDYDDQLRKLIAERPGIREEEIIQELMADDVRRAADDLRPVFDRTSAGSMISPRARSPNALECSSAEAAWLHTRGGLKHWEESVSARRRLPHDVQ